jgi:ApaG protein
MIYKKTSHNITVQVKPSLDVHQSSLEHSYFFYTYEVSFTNHREEEVQLESRLWRIKDGFGNEEVVEGEGVIGQKPLLQPKESFQYVSYCPLRTRTGNMRGYYYFQSPSEDLLQVRIPLFFLRPSPEDEAAYELR